MKSKSGSLLNNNLARYGLITILILMVPLVAMQFSEDVDWGIFDFVIIGMLIFGTGLIYELLTKKLKNNNQRVAVAIILVCAMLLIWVELAVGIFGSPFAGS